MSIVIGGTYKHFKGDHYKVIGIASHSETLEKMVVYKATYGNGDLWVRPYNLFCGKVVREGKEFDRFVYLGDDLRSTYKVHLEFPNDIKRKFFENNIDIEKELARDIENINFDYQQIEDGSHSKDVALIILATGVSLSSILLCVSRLVRAVSDRPREVKIIERNAENIVIKEETVLLEPHKTPQKTEIDFELGTNDIKIKFCDEITSKE